MKKKIIIIFSLILSILFINITPVYCVPMVDFDSGEEEETNYLEGPNFDNKKTHISFDYTIFNPNIIPFFIDKNTGEGFYYTGYIPEITFKKNEINSTDYENFVKDIIAYNDTAEDNPKINECEIYVAFNTQKTHLYYYSPSTDSLEIICNGSRFYEAHDVYACNFYLYLKNFTGFGVTNSSYSSLQSLLDNGWEFMNYVLTQSDSMRMYDVQYKIEDVLLGVYPEWLENTFPYYVKKYGFTILDYNQKFLYNGYWEYSVTTTIKTTPYYESNKVSIKDLEVSYYSKSGTYDDSSYLILEYSTYSADVLPSGDLALVVDYYSTYSKKYERVYTTYTKLVQAGVIDESLELADNTRVYTNNIHCLLLLKVEDIKKLSHFDDMQDTRILGIGVFREMLNGNTYDNTLKTYSYSHHISNSSYLTFNYNDTTQNVVPTTVKGYRLSTNCYNWTRYYYTSIKNSDDTPISDGIVGNDSLDGLLDDLDVSALVDMVGNFPMALRTFFQNIPTVFISLFGFSLTLFCIGTIIRFIRR